MAAAAAAAPAAPPPNVVLIVADDLGAHDLGAYGSKFHETPQLDRLARAGARFTAAYAAAPVCSPSRASILTGQWPARTGITDVIGQTFTPEAWTRNTRSLPAPHADRLPHAAPNFARLLRAGGYATCFAGKWHLGPEGWWPEDQGFDVNYGGTNLGGPYGGGRYFSPYGNPRLPDGPAGEHLADRLAAEAARFIANHRERPFLVYFAPYDVHTPLLAPADLQSKYEAKRRQLGLSAEWGKEEHRDVRLTQDHAVYAAMVETLDRAVGRLLAQLDASGIADRTLVLFTSDNGGVSTGDAWGTANTPLRAGKGWLFEGGLRVPLLVRWPGVTTPGRSIATPVSGLDIFPTILDAAGVAPSARSDGQSLRTLLAGGAAPERTLFWHYPHYGNLGGAPAAALRSGRWKLLEWMEDGRTQLFDLTADPSEQRDLAAFEPRRVAQLQAELHAWQAGTGARFPVQNPRYDPTRPSGRLSPAPPAELRPPRNIP
ncbi:MAG: sulfatase [Opitutaceae bacterium]|nr:sulfatase [Opitutaceae bacterium]